MLTDVSLLSPESGCHLLIHNPLRADPCNKMPQGFNLTASRGAASHRELSQATRDHCHSREKAGAGMTVTGSVKPGLQSAAAERGVCWRASRQCASSLLPALLGVEIPGTCEQMSGQVYDSQHLSILQPLGVVHDLQKSTQEQQLQITGTVWDRGCITSPEELPREVLSLGWTWQ